MWVVTAGLGLVVLTVWLIWRKRRFSVLKELGIPGPEPNILFGNLRELSAKGPLECQKKWIKQYGRVFGYYLGLKPIIVVADPDLLKIIQISEFSKFVNRPQTFQSQRSVQIGFRKALSTLRDRRWKEIRSLVTPSFTTSKLKLMTPIVMSAVDSLVQNIEKKAKSGETFDIYRMYQGLTMDAIGRTAFGIHTDVQNNPNDSFMRAAKFVLSTQLTSLTALFSLSFPALESLWTLIRWFQLSLKNQGTNPKSELFDTVAEVIKMRRTKTSARRNDLLQSMVDAEISEADLRNIQDQDLVARDADAEDDTLKETNGSSIVGLTKLLRRMTNDEIVDTAVQFFLAGYETLSTSLAFTTHFLINYPDVQERIREEVKEVMQSEGALNYTSIHKLKYLDQVFCESLRVYPPVHFFVNREAGDDMRFGNMLIKKGFAVQVPTYFLHHDPELWEEPEKFKPERFSPENKSAHHPMAWQPFGAGSRNCVGLRFAKMEAKLALAHILLKYRLVSTDESEKEPIKLRISSVLLSPAKGVHVKAVPC